MSKIIEWSKGKYEGLFILVVLLLLGMTAARLHEQYPSIVASVARYGLANVVLLYVYLRYVRPFEKGKAIFSFGIVAMGIGGILNGIVTTANNGYMPIHPSLYHQFDGLLPCYIEGGRLLWLADCYGSVGFSIGDLVAFAGLGILLVYLSYLLGARKIK